MLLRSTGIMPLSVPTPAITQSPFRTTTQSPVVRSQLPAATGSMLPTDEDGGFATPADLWANAILDAVLPILEGNTAPVEALAWWYTTPQGGVLALEDGIVTIDRQQIDMPEDQNVEIAISDPALPNSLRLTGEARLLDTALQLTLNDLIMGQENSRWLLSGASPVLAIEALAAQASARDVSLTVAYAQSGPTMQVVLLEATRLTNASQSGTETPGTGTITPTPVALTPTSIRAPEAYLGQIVASRINPGIDEAKGISPSLTQRFIDRHPWAGILATSENGITINNRSTSITRATELVVYLLTDSSGDVTRLFSVEYTRDGTTRFPEDQLIFQAHRMEEILYWIIVRAAERDGQVIVAYDDFEDTQTITLIGFRKFPASVP
jgi:hypothetical protein